MYTSVNRSNPQLARTFLTKTIEVDDEFHQSHRVALQLWDTAGQERFVSLCVAFFRGSDGVVLVYDGTGANGDASASLDRWYEEFCRHADSLRVPVLVLCNKADLLASTTEREAAMRAGEQWAKEHTPGSTFAVVSALNGQGVEKAFLDLARAVWASGEGEDAAASIRASNESTLLQQQDKVETQSSCSC